MQKDSQADRYIDRQKNSDLFRLDVVKEYTGLLEIL